METKIKDLFTTILQLPDNNINEKTTPEHIEKWDSFQHMVLVSAFEEEFSISIEPEEVFEMYRDYGTFKAIIKNKFG